MISPGMCTLETGCGYSTVMFAGAGTNHLVITPFEPEIERVRRFCLEHKLDTTHCHFLVGRSEYVLPTLDKSLLLDLVFIDGAHAYPFPILDWYYAQTRLRRGGMLILDDVAIPSVRVLFDFLCKDANWKLTRMVKGDPIFEKLGESAPSHTGVDAFIDWWPFQWSNATYPDRSFLPVFERAGACFSDVKRKGVSRFLRTKPCGIFRRTALLEEH